MTLFWPTCDDANRPVVKSVIHGATAALYGVMLAYHLAAALAHWKYRT